MSQNNEGFLLQINRDREAKSVPLFGINPTNSSLTTAIPNLQSKSPNNTTISQHEWAYRSFFKDDGNRLVPLTSDSINHSIDRVYFSKVPTINGNLTVYEIEPNYVHIFSTYVFKNSMSTTQFLPNWSGGLTIYVNSGILVKTDYSNFQSKSIPVVLNSGWNQVDILLYTKSTGDSFSINSDLGSFADNWSTPDFDTPMTPTNVSAEVDSNSLGKKDPSTIALRWTETDTNTTLFYNIYRRGPYITGIGIPSISSYSGYYQSGVIGLLANYYYTVSAYIDGVGETLPSAVKNISLSPYISGVTSLSGFSYTLPGAALQSNANYVYVVTASTQRGRKFPVNGTTNQPYYLDMLSTGNAIQLSWSGSANANGYDIYRYSGYMFDPDKYRYGMTTGFWIASVPQNTHSYIDTGIIKPMSTGFRHLAGDIVDLTLEFNDDISFINNSAYLSWSAPTATVSGQIKYKIYRTYYSGIFDRTSLVGITTGLWFIDSGIYSGVEDPFVGKPTSFENIATVSNGTIKYKDTSIVVNQSYDYKVSAVNYSLLEGPLSASSYVVAGDQFAPVTPTGITITSFNGFVTLGWQNGTEQDLDGTKIYKSEDDISYNLIGQTDGTTFSTFVGYSGSPYFKLANYDTSNNTSPLSAAYQGSGTLIADNIILKDFRTFSTLDIDLDNYIYSGFNLSTSVMVRSQMCAIHCPSGVYESYSSAAPPILTLGLERYGPTNTQYTTYSPDGALGGTIAIPYNSGFGITAVEETSQSRYHLLNVAYYTGINSDLYLFNSCFAGAAGVPSIAYTFLTGNVTGIKVGDWITSQFPTTQKEFTNAVLNPVIVTNSGFSNKQVIIYLSGTGADHSVSFGFTSSNKSGLYIGPEKYLNIHNADISKRDGFSAAMDYDGYIHLFYMGSGNNPQTNTLKWYKLDYQTNNNNPITILASGSYSNNGVGGYLFEQSKNKYVLGEPRCFIDELNNIYIMQKGNRAITVVATPFKKTIFSSQITKNGAVLVSPNSVYQIPFEFESTWGIAYTPVTDLAYSWYTLGETAREGHVARYNIKNETYNYRDGLYRRLHSLEFYNNASLYQILQSILK